MRPNYLNAFPIVLATILTSYLLYSCNEVIDTTIAETNVADTIQVLEHEDDLFVGSYAMHYKYLKPNLYGIDPEYIEVDEIDLNFSIHYCTDIVQHQIFSPAVFYAEGICGVGTAAININHLYSNSDPGISETRIIGSVYWENDSLYIDVVKKVTNWPPAPSYEYTITGVGVKIE